MESLSAMSAEKRNVAEFSANAAAVPIVAIKVPAIAEAMICTRRPVDQAIEGQIRGLVRMVDEGRPCLDILMQLSAAQEALSQVGKIVTRNYLENCMSAACQLHYSPATQKSKPEPTIT